MNARINFITLIIGGSLMTILYLLIIRSAALERIGAKAYKRYGMYRLFSSIKNR
jgi:hypothetical protein